MVVKGEVLDSVGPKHDVGGGEDCTVCGWGGIFFIAACMLLYFGFVSKTVDNTPVFWLFLSSTCRASRLPTFCHSALSSSRLGVWK